MDDKYKGRETLKSYFRKGQVPTEEQFAALIDSTYNFRDDGLPSAPEPEPVTPEPAAAEEPVEEIRPAEEDLIRIEANGRWHDLPVEAVKERSSQGCRVYRISALWYHPRNGGYTFCEAIASHSDGERMRIESGRKHWWGWSGHVKLRWREYEGRIYLQIRSRCSRRSAQPLACRIETLWET